MRLVLLPDTETLGQGGELGTAAPYLNPAEAAGVATTTPADTLLRAAEQSNHERGGVVRDVGILGVAGDRQIAVVKASVSREVAEEATPRLVHRHFALHAPEQLPP